MQQETLLQKWQPTQNMQTVMARKDKPSNLGRMALSRNACGCLGGAQRRSSESCQGLVVWHGQLARMPRPSGKGPCQPVRPRSSTDPASTSKPRTPTNVRCNAFLQTDEQVLTAPCECDPAEMLRNRMREEEKQEEKQETCDGVNGHRR